MTENLRYGAVAGDTSATPAARPFIASDAPLSDNVNEDKMQLLTSAKITSSANPGAGWFYEDESNYTEPQIMTYQANSIETVDGTGTKNGVLYNYCAASGGNDCRTNDTAATTSNVLTRDGDNDGVNESIAGSTCPANWELPTYTSEIWSVDGSTDGSVRDWNNLRRVYQLSGSTAGYAKLINLPLSLARVGSIADGSLYDRASSGRGNYWSATPYARDTTRTYILAFGNTEVYWYDSTRNRGRSIRCVAKGANS